MNEYYVYAYLDPRKPGEYKYEYCEFDYEPFYIGKGKKSRILRHLKNEKNNKIKLNKINKIRKEGYEPILEKIFKNLTNEESLIIEKSANSLKEAPVICPTTREGWCSKFVGLCLKKSFTSFAMGLIKASPFSLN